MEYNPVEQVKFNIFSQLKKTKRREKKREREKLIDQAHSNIWTTHIGYIKIKNKNSYGHVLSAASRSIVCLKRKQILNTPLPPPWKFSLTNTKMNAKRKKLPFSTSSPLKSPSLGAAQIQIPHYRDIYMSREKKRLADRERIECLPPPWISSLYLAFAYRHLLEGPWTSGAGQTTSHHLNLD